MEWIYIHLAPGFNVNGPDYINNFLNRISIKTGIDPYTNQPNQSGWCVVDPNRKKSF